MRGKLKFKNEGKILEVVPSMHQVSDDIKHIMYYEAVNVFHSVLVG